MIVRENLEWDRKDPHSMLGIGSWRKGYKILKDLSPVSYSDLMGVLKRLSFSRKPGTKSDILSESEPYIFGSSPEIDGALKSLSIIMFKDYYADGDKIGLFNELFDYEGPSTSPLNDDIFIAVVEKDGEVYLIDPSGYNYVRYAASIMSKGPDGSIQKMDISDLL